MFLGGLAVVVLATESGIGSYDDVLFWDHMVQHLMLIMIAPLLLIFGQPITLLLHASRNPLHTWAKRVVRSRVATFLTWPVFGSRPARGGHGGAPDRPWAGHANETLHNAEHALFLVVGYLFFLPILGSEPIRWRLSYPVRFVILVLAMPIDTFTGVVLGFGTPSSGMTDGPRPAWAPTAVSDLHTGGAVMWIAGDAIMFGLMMVVFLMWAGRGPGRRAAAAGWKPPGGPASRTWSTATRPRPARPRSARHRPPPRARPRREPCETPARTARPRPGPRPLRSAGTSTAGSMTTSISPPTTRSWPG